MKILYKYKLKLVKLMFNVLNCKFREVVFLGKK